MSANSFLGFHDLTQSFDTSSGLAMTRGGKKQSTNALVSVHQYIFQVYALNRSISFARNFNLSPYIGVKLLFLCLRQHFDQSDLLILLHYSNYAVE